MDRDVDEAIASDVQPAERVVDCEGEADERAPREWRPLLSGRQRGGDVPYLFVDDDRVLVIEDEWRGKSVPVDGEAGENQNRIRD